MKLIMISMKRLLSSKLTILNATLLMLLLQSCTSHIDVDLNSSGDIPILSSLFLSKDDPVNVQLIDSLNMNIGESVDLYAIYSNDNKNYSNIPVRWSLINNIGILSVSSGSMAQFNAQTLGVGYIEIEDNDITKRITIAVSAAPDNAPVTLNITPASFDQDTQEIITLSYTDADGDQATTCSISSLSNITETQACACAAGTCTVGVTGTAAYSGAASFDFTVTANSVVSNISTATLTIDSTGLSCPAGFVAVDGNGVLGTTDFCVMQFEAKQVSGTPISQASGTPWVNISATTAQSECESITEGGFLGTFSLISNPEWMTIARDIENYAPNWSGGSVGSGHIPRGHSDNSPSNALAVTDTLDPYDGTGNNSGETPGSGWEQKRTHTLSNGSVIWDLAGNVWEWTDWDAGSAGFTTGPTDEAASVFQLSVNPTGSLTADDYKPDNDTYNSTNNSFGVWSGGSGGAALRGGGWGNFTNAGAFALILVYSPSSSDSSFGFRCVYHP